MKKESPYNEYIGQRFDRLIAVKDLGMVRRTQKAKKPTHFFLFKCDCGKEKPIAMPDVLKGKIHSCGCFREEESHKHGGREEGNPKHGDFYKRIYKIYHFMKSKCLNKNNKSYENFGGRGIKICDEWLNNYVSFRDWSYANGYDEKINNSLCRRDEDKDFSPNNCFFSTISYHKKHAMSSYSKNKMMKKAERWRETHKEEFVSAIRSGVITKLKKYGKLAVNTREKATWKCGWRTIGRTKIYFRSRWEANYGRYLQYLKEHNVIAEWVHEPKTFIFKDGKTFLPDFMVINKDGFVEFHEVKGWNDDRSKHHFDAMKENFPNEHLVVIFSKQYNTIKKSYSKLIPEWEK